MENCSDTGRFWVNPTTGERWWLNDDNLWELIEDSQFEIPTYQEEPSEEDLGGGLILKRAKRPPPTQHKPTHAEQTESKQRKAQAEAHAAISREIAPLKGNPQARADNQPMEFGLFWSPRATKQLKRFTQQTTQGEDPMHRILREQGVYITKDKYDYLNMPEDSPERVAYLTGLQDRCLIGGPGQFLLDRTGQTRLDKFVTMARTGARAITRGTAQTKEQAAYLLNEIVNQANLEGVFFGDLGSICSWVAELASEIYDTITEDPPERPAPKHRRRRHPEEPTGQGPLDKFVLPHM